MKQAISVEIIPFESRYAKDFERLNLEWLEKYFRVEPADKVVLSKPQQIIDDGGNVFLARLGQEIVGTGALIHEGHGHFELSKMAVTARHQGQGIGRKLLSAALEAFRTRGGKELFLETNTALVSAIALYQSVGFVHAKPAKASAVERANVYMVFRPDGVGLKGKR
jgi:ribosomal protein S18 acetylase RimI-like enzyme